MTAVILVAVALIAGHLGHRSHPPSRPVAHRARVAAARARPVSFPLTPGRAPQISPTATLSTPAAAALAAALQGALGGQPGCALAWQGGRTLAATGTGTALATASTQKLLVGAAALARLGPGYRFVTRVEAAAPPVGGSVSQLWLVGSGDPMLSTTGYRTLVAETDHLPTPAPFTPLEALAGAVQRAGITSVPGGIAGDESLLSSERYLPSWKPAYISQDDVGPLSALSLNEGWAQWVGATAPSTDPPAYAARTLAGLLRQDGVSVGPAAVDGVAPPRAVSVASVSSAPLAQIVEYMLSVSDNHIAELLTRLLGLAVYGSGTTTAGTRAVLATDARLGIATAGAVMVDGSGLSTGNRATCPELLGAYELGYQPGYSALHAGLPVAGRTGTLYDVWAGTPLAGMVVAKTGWIDGVGAIVGTVEGRHPVDFSFAVNGTFGFGGALAMETKAAQALLAYSNGP